MHDHLDFLLALYYLEALVLNAGLGPGTGGAGVGGRDGPADSNRQRCGVRGVIRWGNGLPERFDNIGAPQLKKISS